MKLFFEAGEFLLNEADKTAIESKRDQETLELIERWEKGTEEFEINTSGTTGVFKRIVLSRAHMEWSAKQTSQACKLGANEKEFCCLPLDKVGGFMQVIRSVIYNRDLKVVSPVADPMIHLEKNHDFTLTSLTPYQFFHINKSENSLEKLSNFKVILIGGGPISQDLEDKITSFSKWVDTTFYHTYGMTETCSHIALRKIEPSNGNHRFKSFEGVVNKQDYEQCLLISIPELNIEIQTHDIVDLNSEGFQFIGRKDNIINSGGLKIIPEQLERTLEIELLKQGLKIPLYIKGIKDEALGQKCIVVIEAKDQKYKGTISKLLDLYFTSYERPKEIQVIKKFKYTRTNKLIR
jgi:o-succinylbenzoate---CoA ligase